MMTDIISQISAETSSELFILRASLMWIVLITGICAWLVPYTNTGDNIYENYNFFLPIGIEML